MTNKKIKNKIAKVLRKNFNMSFIDSQVIAKAIVDNYNDPRKVLTEDENKLMRELFYLAFFVGWDPKIMRILNGAIDYYSLKAKKVDPYRPWYYNSIVTYEIHNLKNGHFTTTDVED